MRILHVLDHSLPHQSGYAFRSAAILREQRALGWDPYPVTGCKQGASPQQLESVAGTEYRRTPIPHGPLAGAPVCSELAIMHALDRRLESVARELSPHLIHAHSPALNAWPALHVARRLRIPLVYEVRALWEDAAVDHGTSRAGGLRYRATRRLETEALRRADAVTTICAGLEREIRARGVASERVTVVPNAVDAERFGAGTGDGKALRRALGFEEEAPVVGFIGSFYGYEGLDLLLRALPDLRARMADVRLLLVGGGPEEDSLRQQAAALGIADGVRFTGRVPHDAVEGYYDAIDILVYPRHRTRTTELVTPLKPLEAMARGRLLAASDVGGHRELIRDGETGVLFRADDPGALAAAVHELYLARGRWDAIREAARAFVRRERTWHAVVARYAAVYERVLGDS